MKKRMKIKNKNHKNIKTIILFTIFIISIYKTFIYLSKSKIKISTKDFVKILLTENDNNIFKEIITKVESDYKPVNLLNTSYYGITRKEKVKEVSKTTENSIIYIYNTHQKEEYQPTNFVEVQVSPNVMMTSFIMKDIFDKNNLFSIVEENSITDVLKQNNWKYYKSYDVSRMYLEEAKKKNPTLKYFIDVHRDSLPKEQTTTEINGKRYAKVIFLIGEENPNYEKNLKFTNKINELLESKYPTISKGIYKKGGPSVNGVYNQDNSEYTILIEVGGYENTISEVLNTTLAFCDAFMEVIKSNEG